ncbi:MAG: amidohydrolase family protein [Syntrophomonadales bacterium]
MNEKNGGNGLLSPRHRIDAHVHIMTHRRVRGGIKWVRPVAPDYENLSLDVTMEELLDHLEEVGVEAFFNFFYPLKPGESGEINQWHRNFADGCPKAIPFASLHAGDEDKAALISRAMDQQHFVGFKFHPYIQGFSVLDDRLTRVFEELQERQCPVVIHTGFAEFYQRPSMVGDTKELLRRYPRLHLVVAHMLYPDLPLEDWPALLDEYPDLYLDTTNTLVYCQPGTPDSESLQKLIASHSPRLVFGTDFPMGTLYPTGKLHDIAARLCPDQDSLDNLMWRTACRIIGKDLFGD